MTNNNFKLKLDNININFNSADLTVSRRHGSGQDLQSILLQAHFVVPQLRYAVVALMDLGLDTTVQFRSINELRDAYRVLLAVRFAPAQECNCCDCNECIERILAEEEADLDNDLV